MKTFKHSGDMGDIILSLPTVRALSENAILYLDPNGGESSNLVGWKNHNKTKLNESAIKMLKPLLELQSYIEEVRIWKGENVDYDLDAFRTHTSCDMNLAHSHLKAFGLSPEHTQSQWLHVAPNPVSKYVISRSLRYHGNYGYWEVMDRSIIDNAVFVGLPLEYEIFCHVFGHDIEHHKTDSIMEVACVIAGVQSFNGRFLCNQNLLGALGQAMKLPMTVEEYRIAPNVRFNRENVKYV